MTAWENLTLELDRWLETKRRATFWWRDDDATQVSAALDRLLAISDEFLLPLSLAVIPRDANGSLATRLRGQKRVGVLQHGWAHRNHAPDGARQEEQGNHRPRQDILVELAEGWRRVSNLPGAHPVFVAPWNRMDAALLPAFPSIGLAAVSTLGPRDAARPAPGVRRTNVHVDIIDWGGTGGFVGDERAIERVIAHLARRRTGGVDAGEPTGLMTHHLFHDDGCWRFIEEFFKHTKAHPAARWLTCVEAFWS